MTGLYIASTNAGAGKSILSFSLGLHLQKEGYRVGYMKPLAEYHQKHEERVGDKYALMVQELLGQQQPADILSPALIPSSFYALAGHSQETTAMARIASAYKTISQDTDITIVCGSGSFPTTGTFCDADGFRMVEQLGLHVILIERVSDEFHYDTLLSLKKSLGDKMLGLVINGIPDSYRHDYQKYISPYLASYDIPVLGLVPHEPGLDAMRASDLAHLIDGHIISGKGEAASRLVGGYIIGSMQVDNFMTFLRHQEKTSAVIVGGDRTDLQLAALQWHTPCLILTGNFAPCEMVRIKAEQNNIPIISVARDTFSIAKSMAKLMQSKKVTELQQIRLAEKLITTNTHIPAMLRDKKLLPAFATE